MNEEALKQKISEHLELIKYSSASLREAPERASSFLVMVAVLADVKRSCEQDKAKLTTVCAGAYAEALSYSGGKNVTEKKIDAEKDSNYTVYREALEECEAKISWLKTYIDIFNNAHITYRNLAKE
jgi:hypothetical protein